FSPYSDGEKYAVIAAFANRRSCLLLPVLRGEGAGRRMRGSASLGHHEIPLLFQPRPRSPNITYPASVTASVSSSLMKPRVG
ncbi:MAG: hypothetical protein E5W63_06125, partial [Mesorhizobium sp.]